MAHCPQAPVTSIAAAGADLEGLRARLQATLLAGESTAAVRAEIANAEADAAAHAATAVQVRAAAAQALRDSFAAAAGIRAAGVRAALAGRMAALQPPAPPPTH